MKMETEKTKLEKTIDHLRQQVDRKLVVELTRIDQQNRWKVAKRKTTTPTYEEFPDVFSDSDENKLVIDEKPKRKKKKAKKTKNTKKTTEKPKSPNSTVTNSPTLQNVSKKTTTEPNETEENESPNTDQGKETEKVTPQIALPLKKRKINEHQSETTVTTQPEHEEGEPTPTEGKQGTPPATTQEPESEKPIHKEPLPQQVKENPFEIVRRTGEDDKPIITIRVKKRKVKQINIKTERITETHPVTSPRPQSNQEEKEPENQPSSEVGYIEIKPTTPPPTENSPENSQPATTETRSERQEDQEIEEANPPPTISPTPMEVTRTAETSTEQRLPPISAFWRPHEDPRPSTTWSPNPSQTANIHNQIEAIKRRQQARIQEAQRPSTLPIPNIPITQAHQVTTPTNPPPNHPPQTDMTAEFILDNIQNPQNVATSQTKTGRPRGRPPTRDIRTTNTNIARIRPQPIREDHIVAAGREIPITHHYQTGNPSQANLTTHNPVPRTQNPRNSAIQRLINHQRNNNLPTPRPYNLHHNNYRLPFNNNMQIGAPLESHSYPINNPPRTLPTPMSPSIYSRQTLPIPPIFLPANTYWIIRATRTGTHNDMTQVFLWPLYGYNAFENPLATTGTRHAHPNGYPPNQTQQ